MNSLLKVILLLAVVATALCTVQLPSEESRHVRSVPETADDEQSIPAAASIHAESERVRRSPGGPAVYKPSEHKPKIIHPTYKVPTATQRSYRF